MPATLVWALICMTLALICYSPGVWGEKLSGRLEPFHLGFFWAGFAADTTGTSIMSVISGGFTTSVHAITGIAAILLMFAHAVWATIVILRKDEESIVSFHRLSLFVWSAWLIPFLTGLAIAMKR